MEKKIGWKKIKEAVKELITVCGTNYQRELDGQAPLPVFLNRLFLGNPGTGALGRSFMTNLLAMGSTLVAMACTKRAYTSTCFNSKQLVIRDSARQNHLRQHVWRNIEALGLFDFWRSGLQDCW